MAISTTTLGRNLSRFELLIAIFVVGVLCILFFSRMRGVEVAAEQAMARARVQDMQARLMGLHARLISADPGAMYLSPDDIVAEIGQGEIVLVDDARTSVYTDLPGGSWVYIRARTVIEYRVISGTEFTGAAGDPPSIRFQLVLRYAEPEADGRRRLRAVTLLPLGASAHLGEPE